MKKSALVLLMLLFAVGYSQAGIKGLLKKFAKEFNQEAVANSAIPFTASVEGNDILVLNVQPNSDFAKEVLAQSEGRDREKFVEKFIYTVFDQPGNMNFLAKLSYETGWLKVRVPYPGRSHQVWEYSIYFTNMYSDIKSGLYKY